MVGSWFIDSTDTLFAIVFFIDGRYAHFEVVPDDLENSGFELGNYKRDQSTGKVTATPLFDENSDYGLSAFKDDNNSGDLLINITSDKATAEIDEDGDGNIDDSVDFVANQNANEIGTWILDEPDMEDGEFMMFTFYSNGTFVEAEIVPDSDDESGMEWGTYAIDNDTNQLTATITFDSNTDAGISDFITTNTPIYIVIDGDTATLSIDEDNDGEADDAVTLNRLK